jgi:hypothetical protein
MPPTILCASVERSVAALVDATAFVWLTLPSSPGLSTRTEMERLHEAQLGGSAAGAAASLQSQFQFQTQSADPEVGRSVLDPVESSVQFQFQFQTQVAGGSEGIS